MLILPLLHLPISVLSRSRIEKLSKNTCHDIIVGANQIGPLRQIQLSDPDSYQVLPQRMYRNIMRLIRKIRNLTRPRNRSLMLISVLVILTVASPFIAHKILFDTFDQIDARAEQAKRDEIAKKEGARYERLTNPISGATREQIAAVSIGMTDDEVELAINYGYDLGIGGFPVSHRHNDLHGTADEITIKGVGHIQAVFIEKQLVGLGSLNPNDGRLCGGCLDDMLNGNRDWPDGLPYHVNGLCPVCKSEKVIRTHAEHEPKNFISRLR